MFNPADRKEKGVQATRLPLQGQKWATCSPRDEPVRLAKKLPLPVNRVDQGGGGWYAAGVPNRLVW